MSVVACVTVPAEEFSLGTLLEVDPEVTITVETTVPMTESVVPYLWVPERVVDPILRRLRRDDAIESAAVLDVVDGYALVKVIWSSDVNGFVRSIRESDALVTSASGTGDTWTFRLRFPSYEELSRFYSDCEERGLPVELVQLRDAGEGGGFGLTPPQREVVLTAYEDGYFEVPRGTTLVELGEKFGVTDSAVSQRLRRGLAALVDSTLDREPGSAGSDSG